MKESGKLRQIAGITFFFGSFLLSSPKEAWRIFRNKRAPCSSMNLVKRDFMHFTINYNIYQAMLTLTKNSTATYPTMAQLSGKRKSFVVCVGENFAASKRWIYSTIPLMPVLHWCIPKLNIYLSQPSSQRATHFHNYHTKIVKII